MSGSSNSHIKLQDLEKNNEYKEDFYVNETLEGDHSEEKLSFVDRIVGALNAENKGIERVLEHERNPNEGIIEASSMWFSANLVIASMALGMIGVSAFGLNFGECMLTIVFFNILGLIAVAFFSTFGPEFGLRQMVLSRFLVGGLAVRIFSFITGIACVGWGAVNIMVSAQLLNMVNRPHSLPPWAGCLVLIICTIVVTFFGYKAVHAYEKWSWIPNLMVFLVFIARLAQTGNFTAGEWGSGPETAAGVLSFGGAVFGFATGWATYAADYTVFIRKDYPKWKIFVGVSLGLFIPLTFTMALGAACMTGIYADPVWAEYYDNYQNGGLLFAILAVDSLGGFGQFCAVLLAMSTVANNIPNMYTIAFCAQAFWSPLQKVPRIFWTIFGNFATLAICIPGYYHFEDVMDNFMDLIGYYLAIYQTIAFSEHFIYKKGKFENYDIEGWNDPSRYPKGYAGTIAFCFGVFGTVMGMDQVWYMGKIAALIGGGADIGFELAAAFSFIAYNVARPLEIKYTGV